MAENKLQKGFIFRQENCVGCGGCTIACQIHNELPEDVRFRKVDLYEVKDSRGRIRDVWLSHACMHCSNPGCGLCRSACPYDAIVISKKDGKAAKCNMCIELLDAGLNPACVDGCPIKCLKVGNTAQVLNQTPDASRQGIGYRDGPNRPNMVIIRRRR